MPLPSQFKHLYSIIDPFLYLCYHVLDLDPIRSLQSHQHPHYYSNLLPQVGTHQNSQTLGHFNHWSLPLSDHDQHFSFLDCCHYLTFVNKVLFDRSLQIHLHFEFPLSKELQYPFELNVYHYLILHLSPIQSHRSGLQSCQTIIVILHHRFYQGFLHPNIIVLNYRIDLSLRLVMAKYRLIDFS